MEKIILLKGDRSKWYDQAIFIVKQNIPSHKLPVDLVSEAEKIIERYLQRTGKPDTKRELTAPPPKAKHFIRKSSGFDIFLNTAMLFGCMVLAGVLAYSWFL